MVALVLLFTASSNTHPTLAIKPGFYEQGNLSTILKEVGTAEVQLECCSTDHIKISGGGVNPNNYYSWERVREILKSQKKKDFLVATLSKAYPGRYNKDALELENFKSFLSSLGYKRHLVVSSNGFGIEVLWDSKEPPSPTTDPEISQTRALEEAFQASEWVGRVRYLRYETRGKVTLTNPPTAIFAPITCFKGPPISHNLTILFEFDPPETKEKQDNWKFNESMMPGPKSEWIIFIPNAVLVPGKGFITYRGSFGRMEATQKNVEALYAVIRRHHGEN
ncbi:MAG: hypothetical protein JST01_06570 [Cyanobacteria bacterium SZAS TMP-1]|nr:hypothetical protein [Cyanobacteria bacterium SZAS TMP-1]